MNGYICTKACTLGGVAYNKGDAIPFEAVLPSRERALIKQGYISHATVETATETPVGTQNEPPAPQNIIVPITTKDGVLELNMAPEDIVAAITTMQLNAEEAAKAVGAIDKEETLILIDVLDTRKTVKTAIREKVEAMKGGTEDESQGDA
ncbi:MAG: hypothetical protein M1571_04300 [Firmicutes bacterium]|nr:hypothetical protein [Bacillota bacterium]